MKKSPIKTRVILTLVLLTAYLVATSWAKLPVKTPPSGTSWSIAQKSQGRTPTPKTPEEAAALKLHQMMVPKLERSVAYRVGDQYMRVDEYAGGRKLQTYVTRDVFIEEAFSGNEIVASSRSADDRREIDWGLVFFPELAGFENAEPLGKVPSGTKKGLLKFVLHKRVSSPSPDDGVRSYLAEQGVELVEEQPVEEYLLVNPVNELPVEYNNGTTTATYVYSPVSQLPPLSPTITKFLARIKNDQQPTPPKAH